MVVVDVRAFAPAAPAAPVAPVAPVAHCHGYRPDIDGLRAVAVLLVVAYHAGLPGFAAGFIGVDVFFVLSGYLITLLLVGELDSSGTVQLGRFWARRARRLVPAAAAMVVTVLLAGPLVLSALDWDRLATEGFATATYWSNVLFGGRTTNYFAEGLRPSPLLHTWSLAVEEQFYIAWPVLLLVVHRLAARSGGSARRTRFLAVLVLTLASFALSVRLADQGSAWAFFSPLSRAWELGAGALVALGAPALARRTRSSAATRTAVTIVGGALLAAALVIVDHTTAFPGLAAMLPVLATVAFLVAGMDGSSSLGRLLSARPLIAIGRLSYSWYLWHWPVIVLGVTAFGHATPGARMGLAALSLAPALVTHHLVENPVRYSRRLIASVPRAATAIGAIVAVSVIASLVTTARAANALAEPRMKSLAAARADTPPLEDECASTDPATLARQCVMGDPAGATTVLVVGDSHSAQWLPALDWIGLTSGWRVIHSLQGDCSSLGITAAGQLPSCGVRQQQIPGLIEGLNPDLVVLSHSIGYIGHLMDRAGRPITAGDQLPAWGNALADLARSLKARGIPLAVILDTPRHESDPIDCLSRSEHADRCALPLDEVRELLGPFHDAEVDALRGAGHGSALDPLLFLCTDALCPAVLDGQVVYCDVHHLAATFSASLHRRLAPFLESTLARETTP